MQPPGVFGYGSGSYPQGVTELVRRSAVGDGQRAASGLSDRAVRRRARRAAPTTTSRDLTASWYSGWFPEAAEAASWAASWSSGDCSQPRSGAVSEPCPPHLQT